MAELQAKYQKLATEYSKLKAQIPVLKKAFLDEQEEKHILKDNLKEKEQNVRKYEQETESLAFRNQQLSRRVLLLQEELENAEINKKKSKVTDISRGESSRIDAGVFNEELEAKIKENASLHKQVNESSQFYETKVQALEENLRSIELKHSQYNEVLNDTKQQSKSQIDKLLEDKALFEVKLQSQDNDVKQFKMRAEVAEIKLNSVQGDLSSRLELATKLLSQNLPFIDTLNKDLNGLNLPTFDRKYQSQSSELVHQATTYVSELVQGLSNFFTYSEQRSKIYPADGITETISEVNVNYCKLLHSNLVYLRPIEQSLKQFGDSLKEDSLINSLKTSKDLQLFTENFHKFVEYNNKLLPFQLLSIEEECSISSCPSTLSSKNMELHKSLQKFNDVLNSLESYLTTLGDINNLRSSTDNISLFRALVQITVQLQESTKEVSKHYNAKVSLEHQLPTATQKLKTTDECVVSSLISLVTSTSKIASFMSSNEEFFNERAGYNARGNKDNVVTNPIVCIYRQKTAHYLTSLSKPCPESVPYRIALQNRKILLSSAENKEGLSKQIQKFQHRVTSLEQDKEHYMLELQLLKIKYENELHKYKKLEKELENIRISGTDEIKLMESLPSSVPNTDSNKIQSSIISQLEIVSVPDSDVECREELIKSHYNSRLNQLTLLLQHSDSKCVNYHAEVRALHKQLQLAEKQKSQSEEDLRLASQSLAQLKDEHQTTTKNYENQLSMMSEHLAGMNEKLARQKDEIDEQNLQLQGKVKGSKKKK